MVALKEEKSTLIKAKPVPPYMKRAAFVPRKVEDFGEGGAFPEIHIAQYPLDMERVEEMKPGSKILPVNVDSHGNLAFDAMVKQNEEEKKIVNVTFISAAWQSSDLKYVPKQSSNLKYVKYMPPLQSAVFIPGAKERIIGVVEMHIDPFEPSKFKHKSVPKASRSPPVSVIHSPPRPLTVKDQQDWKIPPCISNWKNLKGYTIPLNKRLAADGRGLHKARINDAFAKLSEALYIAEHKAREAVAMRSKVQKEMMMKEKERKEQELRALAAKARSKRTDSVAPSAAVPMSSNRNAMDIDLRVDYDPVRKEDMPKESKEEREKRLHRETIREERSKERRRKRSLEAKDAAMGKNSKIAKDRSRDISEKVALGMASTGAGGGGEIMHDQRLFNQEKGIDSGFATDDQYNIYDKGIFTAAPTLSTLYKPNKDVMDSDMYGAPDEQLEKTKGTERFKPHKEFAGTSERKGPRDRPVEFEKVAEEADPFGLDQFLTEVKKGIRKPSKK